MSFKDRLDSFVDKFSVSLGSILFSRIPSQIKDFLKKTQQDTVQPVRIVDVTLERLNSGYKLNLKSYSEPDKHDKVSIEIRTYNLREIREIPSTIAKQLKKDGSVSIRISDLATFLLEHDVEVQKAVYFNELSQYFRGLTQTLTNPANKKIVSIEEKFFSVNIKFIIKNNDNHQSKSIRTKEILNLPDDVRKALDENQKVELEF